MMKELQMDDEQQLYVQFRYKGQTCKTKIRKLQNNSKVIWRHLFQFLIQENTNEPQIIQFEVCNFSSYNNDCLCQTLEMRVQDLIQCSGIVPFDLFNQESNEPCGILKLEIIFKKLTDEMIGNASSQNMTRDLFDQYSKQSFFQKSSSKIIQTPQDESLLKLTKNTFSQRKSQNLLSPTTSHITSPKKPSAKKLCTSEIRAKGRAKQIGYDAEIEPMSYKGLIKDIEKNHPMDPDLKERFGWKERLTVKDFEWKLVDALYLYSISQSFQACCKKIKKRFRPPKTSKFVRPDTLNDMPESGSSSDSDPDLKISKGLTTATQQLGNGAALYLQTMKALAIMFVMLTVINLPLIIIYADNTQHNNYLRLSEFFKYFTIGNLGQTDSTCGYSSVNFANANGVFYPDSESRQVMNLTCDEDYYIDGIKHFGFLYHIDRQTKGISTGPSWCDHVKNPEAKRIKIEKKDREKVSRVDVVGNDEIDQKELLDTQIEKTNERLPYPFGKDKQKEYEWLQSIQTGFLNSSNPYEVRQNDTSFNIDSQCRIEPANDRHNSNLFRDDKKKEKFFEHFEKTCEGKQQCFLSPDEMEFEDAISDQCIDRIRDDHHNTTSREYLIVIGCNKDWVYTPFTFKQFKFSKQNVGTIAVIIDIVSVFVISLFLLKLESINAEYLAIMDNMIVQMTDFGVYAYNLKMDKHTQDSRVIRMKLWLHLNQVLKPFRSSGNKLQIVDICLSCLTEPSTPLIFNMQKVKKEILEIQTKILSGEISKDNRESANDQVKALRDKYARINERFQQIRFQERDISSEKVDNRVIQKKNRLMKVRFAFIIFKHCLTNEVALNIFKKESMPEKIVRKIFRIQEKKINTSLNFLNQPLDIHPIIQPREVSWQNLSCSDSELRMRSYSIRFLALFFMIAATILIVYIEIVHKLILLDIPDYYCPSDPVTKMEAYIDKTNVVQNGLMGCYCQGRTSTLMPWTWFAENFDDIVEELGTKKKDKYRYYCFFWLIKANFKYLFDFVYLGIAVILNGIISKIFKNMDTFQKKHTKIKEASSIFIIIFLLEFSNMGLVVLITGFDGIGLVSFLMGNSSIAHKIQTHEGFNADWYMDCGNYICLIIYMSAFFSSVFDIFEFIIVQFKRWKDRGFKSNLKKDLDDEDDDEPNTKQQIQQDLVKLYTGKEFEGERAYSRLMSTLFVLLFYSSGMPILYLIGSFFYIFCFLITKVLILKFYKKSRTLTRTIPLTSMKIIQYSLVLHMCCACFMLTNPEIFLSKDDRTILTGLKNKELSEQIQETIKILGELPDENLQPISDFLASRFQMTHQKVYVIFMIGFIFVVIIGKSMIIFFRVFFKTLFFTLRNLLRVIFKHLSNIFRQFVCRINGEPYVSDNKLEEQEIDSDDSDEEIKMQQEHHFNHVMGGANSDINFINDAQAIVISKDNFIHNSVDENLQKEHLGIKNLSMNDQMVAHIRAKTQKMKQQQEELDKIRHERPDFSEDIVSEMSPIDLMKFYERSWKDLFDFWNVFRYDHRIDLCLEINDQTQKLLRIDQKTSQDTKHLKMKWKILKELCYMNRISLDQVLKYQNILTRRITEVEHVIDKQFNFILDEIENDFVQKFEAERVRQKKAGLMKTLEQEMYDMQIQQEFLRNSPEMKFEEYSYFKKLRKLDELEDRLYLKDMNRTSNRSSQKTFGRLLFKGNQSYFIFDNDDFKIARSIYYQADDFGISSIEKLINQQGRKKLLGKK